MALRFPNLDTLSFALSEGLIPPDVVAGPARFKTADDGDIWIEPSSSIQATVADELKSIGVTAEHTGNSVTDDHVQHWLQLIPLVKHQARPDITGNQPVIFELVHEAALTPFVTELLRLGNNRIAIHSDEEQILVQVYGPPYYTLLSALDRMDANAPRAYVEQTPRFWIEIGWTHPFVPQIEVADCQLVLIDRDNHWRIQEGPDFRDVSDVLQIQPLANVINGTAATATEPFDIPLQFTPASTTDPATLWVIGDNAIPLVDQFVQDLNPELLDRFSFANCEVNGESFTVIRLRPSRSPRPEVLVPGDPYRSYLRLPNLFIPMGKRVNPPLRRESLRNLIASDPVFVTWLAPSDDGGFVRESIPDASFRPLSGWIQEMVCRDTRELSKWVASSQFEFAAMTQPEELTVPQSKVAKPNPKPGPTPPAESTRERPFSKVNKIRQRPVAHISESTKLPQSESESRARLRDLETQFLSLDGALDSKERLTLWPQLARQNAELRQSAEAALAWAHAMWDHDRPADEHLWGWVLAERALSQPEVTVSDWERRLTNDTPTTGDMRSFAAVLAWAAYQQPIPATLQPLLSKTQSYLQTHEHLLPVRPLWLAWSAWSHASGDSLTLARARDRLLNRLLDRGLNAELDLPSFLRFAGREDGDRLRAARGWVEDIRIRLRQWFREQTHADLRTDPTVAYMDLMFAFGLARLGEASAAQALVKQAEAVLGAASNDTSEAHAFLLQAYSWRTDEVLAGRPHAGPLPAEMLDYLLHIQNETSKLPKTGIFELRRTCPYAIERLRKQSRILEPQEEFDPYRGTRHEGHELVRDAARLPDVRDIGQLPSRITQLIRSANKPDLLVRVLTECIAVAGRIQTEAAGKLLDRVVPALDAVHKTDDRQTLEGRLKLLARSLFFSAHFDRDDLVSPLIERLLRMIESDSIHDVLEHSSDALGQTIATLRKLGMRDEIQRVLERTSAALLRGQTIEQWSERPVSAWVRGLAPMLQLAVGWTYLDQPARAQPILNVARAVLQRTSKANADKVAAPLYVAILCNTIAAYGHLTPNEARSQIQSLFEKDWLEMIPNTFTSRTFYSWLHLNVAESVVLALASQEFALGPAARHWLDEDEYLIRRRIHRDVRRALNSEHR